MQAIEKPREKCCSINHSQFNASTKFEKKKFLEEPVKIVVLCCRKLFQIQNW